MSVYTSVDSSALHSFLASYRLGPLEDFAGIAGGVENTNYFVDTASGRYVLTIFERLSAAEAGRYLDFMARLAAARVSCPRPIPDASGRLLASLRDKPAALVSRVPGHEVRYASPAHCAAIGRWLATMHGAQGDLVDRWPNPRGFEWRRQTALGLRHQLTATQRELLDQALAIDGRLTGTDMPRGIVHADLFRDNALFADPDHAVIGGVIDFYFAGEDALLFDLAVAANDWTVCEDGEPDVERESALVDAYRRQRPLSETERSHWSAMRQIAALRFWLSRLADAFDPRPGSMVLTKDPTEYERLLRRLSAG